MKKCILFTSVLIFQLGLKAQTNPAIINWLQNTTTTGRYYNQGNSTPQNDVELVNVQSVQYDANYSYVSATGIPAYITGPFLDGNPSVASAQNSIFKVPLNPAQNTGTPTSTTPGNIGVFINGVALFDYRDGVAWNPSSGALCGGPGNPPCGPPGTVMDWNRDAIPAEMGGFDCSKGHPAMGNYHHHQNPSAFKLDLSVLSTICNTYDADGLYAIDSTIHSPLIGFAYDGYPIYGAYSYANINGTGGIIRMKSSYSLSGATTRTNGPNISATYFDGYFREDYQYTATASSDYLDDHNGRFCVTPEYPNGIYCYFATVDDNWNSTYPYVVGPTFYGVTDVTTVGSIPGGVTTYTPSTTDAIDIKLNNIEINVYPNPASDYLVMQFNALAKNNIAVEMYDIAGKLVQKTVIYQGSTIAHIDTRTLYNGQYIIRFSSGKENIKKKIIINRD